MTATAARTMTILVLDDEPDVLDAMQRALESGIAGCTVITASNAADALELLTRGPVDAIVSDFRMPGANGLEFLRQVREATKDVPKVLVTAFPNLDGVLTAEARVSAIVVKPFAPERLVRTVEGLLAQAKRPPLRPFVPHDAMLARALGDGLHPGTMSLLEHEHHTPVEAFVAHLVRSLPNVRVLGIDPGHRRGDAVPVEDLLAGIPPDQWRAADGFSRIHVGLAWAMSEHVVPALLQRLDAAGEELLVLWGLEAILGYLEPAQQDSLCLALRHAVPPRAHLMLVAAASGDAPLCHSTLEASSSLKLRLRDRKGATFWIDAVSAQGMRSTHAEATPSGLVFKAL